MTIPLQKAAQAILKKWDNGIFLEDAIAELRKALDAELAQVDFIAVPRDGTEPLMGLSLSEQEADFGNISEPVAWHPTEAAITALKRFEETCADNEGYDVPKDTMRNLQAIGLIYRTYGDMYCITDFGQHILASPPAKAEQSSDRAELIAGLQGQAMTFSGAAANFFQKAADMLEADVSLINEGNKAQQAKRVPMTPQELLDLMPTNTSMTRHDALEWMARAVERHHGITQADKPTDWSAA